MEERVFLLGDLEVGQFTLMHGLMDAPERGLRFVYDGGLKV